MNSDQIMSIVRSLLKLVGGMLIAHGASKAASWINTEDAVGLVMTIIGFVTSHVTHKDDSQPTGTSVPLSLIAFLLLPVFLIGCAGANSKLEVGGAYAPATFQVATNSSGGISTNVVQTLVPDLAFYAADATFDLAYSTIDGAFKFERDNRSMLWSISPNIKHTLDGIRPTAWKVVQRYTAARAAYMANPTPVGLSLLQDAATKIQALAAAAQAATSTVTTNK